MSLFYCLNLLGYYKIKLRTDAAQVKLDWNTDELSDDHYLLNPRQKINLDRILRESITNILKHAQPQSICICINKQNNRMKIMIVDDGTSSDCSQWQANTGLNSLQTRSQEIKAELSWVCSNDLPGLDQGTQLTITLPEMEKKSYAFSSDC